MKKKMPTKKNRSKANRSEANRSEANRSEAMAGRKKKEAERAPNHYNYEAEEVEFKKYKRTEEDNGKMFANPNSVFYCDCCGHGPMVSITTSQHFAKCLVSHLSY